MTKKKFIKGDTLIEILFSVAVFGLVAISTVAAMNRGVSQAQSSLESSVARTEIEAQAEVLRYINNAYAAQSKFKGKYAALWEQVAAHATDPDNIPAIVNVNSCADAYNPDSNDIDSVFSKSSPSFIVNSRILRDYVEDGVLNASDVIVSSLNGDTPNTEQFAAAPLYPRLIYDNNGSIDTSVDILDENLSTTNYSNLQKAEGVWIVAAYDDAEKPTFYDFYIRTCWLAPGDSHPSTITTTIRLYNPDVEVNSQNKNDFTLNYHKRAEIGSEIIDSQTKTVVQGTYTFPIVQDDPGTGPSNKQFMGWYTKPDYDATDGIYNKERRQIQSTTGTITTSTVITMSPGIVDLYPIYGDLYSINIDCNGGTNCPTSTNYYAVSPPRYKIPTSPTPTKSDGIFKGWSTTKNGPVVYCPDGYSRCGNPSANTVHGFTSTVRTLNLYAVWGGYNYGLNYDLNINPGDEIIGAPDAERAAVTEEEDYIFAVNTSNMSRTDPKNCVTYTFLGWSTNKNATTPTYKAGDTNGVIKATKDDPTITLFAVWREDATEGVCYDYKIVLTWGQNPRDLDSHLIITGTAATHGSSHVYYSDKRQCNSTPFYYCLDLDDTSSYGPETTMIKLDPNSTYTFYVHNYAGSGSIGSSPAVVALYSHDEKIAEYTAPKTATGGSAGSNFSRSRWEVFRITTDVNRKATITTLNNVTN